MTTVLAILVGSILGGLIAIRLVRLHATWGDVLLLIALYLWGCVAGAKL